MFGGIYADVDMTCEKSLTSLLTLPKDFMIGVSNTKCFEVNNGILIGKKGTPLLKHFITSVT